jgi:hypothetical protein
MAVYGPVCHHQKLRSIYYFLGSGPVHILPYDPQCHELFAIYLLQWSHVTWTINNFNIKGFCVFERRILIQFGIQFHRQGIELLPERKWTFISMDLTVNIQASFKLHKYDFCNCIVLYSGTPQTRIPLKTEHLV